MKIQVNSQGKVYLTSGGNVLKATGDKITALNYTGSAVNNGDKVWLTRSGSSYSIKNFSTNIPSFTNYNVTISNQIASGFSTSNYLYSDTNFRLNDFTNWEAVIKFNTSDVSTTQLFFGIEDFSFLFGIDGNTSKCIFYASNSSGSWNIASGSTGSTVLQTNTDYYVKITFSGGAYNIYLSTTGAFEGEETTEITVVSTYKCMNGVLYLGVQKLNQNIYVPLNGSIDLSATYFKTDDCIIWKPYYSNVSSEYITGVAQENISNGSSGVVSTVLGD